MASVSPIDARAPRFNQAVVALLLGFGFAFDVRPTVPIAGVVLLLSALGVGPFLLLWRHVIGPRVAKPTELEDPRPPRFAAAVGVVFLAGSIAAFAGGVVWLGWALALVVAALAGLAAITGLCVGCEVYVFVRRRSRGGWVPAA